MQHNVWLITFFLIGAMCGSMLTGIEISLSTTFITNSQQRLISECEKNLPRTQHCVLTAIPANEKPE